MKGIIYHVYYTHNNSIGDGYIGVTSRPVQVRLKEHRISNSNLGKYLTCSNLDDISLSILYEGSIQNCYSLEKDLRSNPNIGWNIAIGGGNPPVTTSKSSKKGHKTKLESGYYKSDSFLDGIRKSTLSKKNSGFYKTPIYKVFQEKGTKASVILRETSGYYESEKFLTSRVRGGKTRFESGYYESASFRRSHAKAVNTLLLSHPTYNRPVYRSIVCGDTRQIIEEFESIRDASKAVGKKCYDIDNVCKGITKTCAKSFWSYK